MAEMRGGPAMKTSCWSCSIKISTLAQPWLCAGLMHPHTSALRRKACLKIYGSWHLACICIPDHTAPDQDSTLSP